MHHHWEVKARAAAPHTAAMSPRSCGGVGLSVYSRQGQGGTVLLRAGYTVALCAWPLCPV